MKKLISLTILVAAAALLFACKSSNSPEAVAEKAVSAIQKGDYDAYAATFNLDEKDQKMLAGLVEEKASEALKNKGGIKSYKIVESNVEGESAKVKVHLVYKDGSEEDDNMSFKLVDGVWKQELDK